MKAFMHHFSFEFRTGIRNRQLLLMNYLFPLGFYVMMGLIMAEINPFFREDIIPAMVVFSILSSTLLGIPDQLVNARENGIFRTYKINGVPPISIITIPALTTLFHLVIVITIIILTAPVLFDAPLPVNWGLFIFISLAMSFASAGISVLIGVISSSTRMTVLWAQLIYLPSMIVGGMMVPHAMLPEFAAKLSRLLPATHAMNAFNELAMGKAAQFSPWLSLIVLLTSGVLAFLSSLRLFNWDRKNVNYKMHPLFALAVIIPYLLSILLIK
jgi:ABC-2 type transport system permease protein